LVFQKVPEGPSLLIQAHRISLAIRFPDLSEQDFLEKPLLFAQIGSPTFQELAKIARHTLP
jgi:hypothetical protein